MAEASGPKKIQLNRFVKVDVRTVEPQQFEASFSYKLGDSQNDTYVHPKYYRVESYLFFPPQMNVNPTTYPVEHFYRDMKSYINFRIPKLSYREIIGLTDNPHRSPLKKIKRELSSIQPDSNFARASFVRQEARLFGCSYYNFLMRKVKKLDRRISFYQSADVPDQNQDAIITSIYEETLTKIRSIFHEWRRIADKAYCPKPQSLQEEFDLVDEYLMQVTCDFLLQLSEALERLRLSRKVKLKTQHLMRVYLRSLRIYSRNKQYMWIDDRSSEAELEAYQYRRGLLKRKVWSALYLNPRVKPLFTFQKQAGAMIAAGAAATWAFLAEVAIRTHGSFSGSASTSIEASTFILLTAFAMAYILKDRIKELGRGYFKGGIFGRLPDSSNKIIYPKDSSGQKDITVGTYEEKVSFRASNRLPDDINSIADEYFPFDEEESRSIICYQQKFSLKELPIRNLRRKMRAIYSFYRLNISSLLGPLDKPEEPALVPSQDLHVIQRQLPKVYHLDLIMKITGKVRGKTAPVYRIFRLVINKEGIVRLENWSSKINLARKSLIP